MFLVSNMTRKICVTATGPSLDAPVDPRFGRCAYFLIIDVDELRLLEAIQNPAVTAPGGAGIQSAQLVVSKGVEAVITGNVGPNAFQVLSAARIPIYTGNFRSVREAVEAYRSGKLQPMQYSAHQWGMGFGMRRHFYYPYYY